MNREPLHQLLSQTECCGIYRLPPDSREALRHATEFLDHACFEIDFQELGKIPSVLKTLGQQLGFPNWYGANLDALSDCLTDFSWHESRGYVFVISGADALHTTSSAFAKINTVFTHVIEEWRTQDIPFWIFYDMSADDLPPLTLPVRE